MSENKGNPDELGWDDEIEPGDGFQVLPEGLAQFEVLKFDRSRREMGKLGMINVAILRLMLTSSESGETATREVKLPLHRKVQFKLYQFFTAIGQRKHGQDGPFAPDWTKVVGSTGFCEIKHRRWTGKDGKERIDDEPEKFLSEEEAAGATPGGDNLKF